MIKKEELDIVIFGLTRLDGPYSSTSISLAKELAGDHRVYYINHPFSLKDLLGGLRSKVNGKPLWPLLFGKGYVNDLRIDNQGHYISMVTIPATLPINFLPAGKIFNWLHQINGKIFFAALRKLIKEKDIGKFLFLNAFDPYFGLKFPDTIKPLLKIYYCMDDMEEAEYTRKHGRRLEKEMMGEYDITLTTSQEILRNNSAFANFIYCLPNAADPSLFEQAYFKKFDRPEEFEGVTKKVIGFIGNIEQRMDYELVKKVASAHNDKIIYLIGPASSDEYRKEGLDKIENIVFTGGKNINELPAYLQNIDCTIIPFRCNKLTKSIYPLKINEYLSGGKPVVTTNFSDAIREFNDVIYLADNHSRFVHLIDTAINEDSKALIEKRIAFAKKNSWKARIEDFWKILDIYLSRTK